MLIALRPSLAAFACMAFQLSLAQVPAAHESEDLLAVTRVFEEQAGTRVSWRDILEVGDMGGIAVSPDGKHVAFIVRRAKSDCCYEQQLYLVTLEPGRPLVIADLGQPFSAMLPDGRANGSPVTPGPRWSPDGRYLAYLSNSNGRPDLSVFDLSSKESVRLSTPKDKPALGFTWSDDATQVIVQSGGAAPAVEEKFKRGLQEGFLYGDDFLGAGYEQLPLLPSVPIFHGDGTIFGSARGPVPAYFRLSVDGSLAPARNEDAALFFKAGGSFAMGPFQSPMVVASPWQELVRKRRFPGAVDYQVVLRSKPTSAEHAIACEESCDRPVESVYWNKRVGRFVVQRREREHFRFSVIDPDKLSEQHAFEVGRAQDGFSVLDPSCDLAGGVLACVEEGPTSPPRLVLLGEDGARKVLFDPNERLRTRHFNRVDRLEWKNSLEATAYGFLVYPASYQPGRRYPFVVVQYDAAGFLRGGSGNENPVHPYAEAGFFVLVFRHPDDPKAFRQRTFVDEWQRSAAQYRERQAWILDSLERIKRALEARGLIDATKVAYTGFSGGANFVDFALANGHDPAVVICSQCGIGPDLDFTHPLNILSGRMRVFGFPNPLLDPDYLERYGAISAALHVDELHGAFLFNQGQFELVGAFPLYARLRHAKRAAELYVYHGEHHVKYQPSHRGAIYERNLDWLRFWLQGLEDSDPRKAEQYRRWKQMRAEAPSSKPK